MLQFAFDSEGSGTTKHIWYTRRGLKGRPALALSQSSTPYGSLHFKKQNIASEINPEFSQMSQNFIYCSRCY